MYPGPRAKLKSEAARIAETILSNDKIVVASHIDADGISAAAVASAALDLAELEHETLFFKKLDERSVEMLTDRASDALVWLTDMGSAYSSRFGQANVVITDHHQMEEAGKGGPSSQTTLFSFSEPAHLNPQFFGYAGARDISGAGLAYMVAVQMDRRNERLAPLPIVGAIGDMQDLDARRLIGLNCEILETGVRLGLVRRTTDLRLFGTETRPLPKLLEYASDPYLPGLTGDPIACEEFLRMLKIDIVADGDTRRWSDLTGREKYRIIRALAAHILENGGSEEDVVRLRGEVYTFPAERRGSPTREAREFATLLNSCGRNNMADLGLRICKGEREEAFERAMGMLREHRENLHYAMEFVRGIGVVTHGNIQHFHCADQVRDTIIGIIAGMMLGSGEVDRSKPIVGFAISQESSGEYRVKASIRSTRELVDKGLNLAVAARLAAESIGGIGGGHDVAAGATIPLGTEEEFVQVLDRKVREQLGGQMAGVTSALPG